MIQSNQITDVKLGKYQLYREGVGDTWDPAWAADGSLYTPGNDGSGWEKACASNVFFNRISGGDYRRLDGSTLNGMQEYGGWAKEGPDGCTWKSSGCGSVNGVLYFGVARHNYGTKSRDPFMRQTASHASIIKSIDNGLSWVRTAQENYDRPMFPGSRFATPYFIYYGQDGEAPKVDGADQYIYAISNNGFWCNGDNYILGRVEKEHIGRLDAADWEFYTGGDGELEESWSKEMGRAALVIDNPLKCGETGATYIPSIGRYILVAWYYPGNPNIETDETRFIYYDASHPWGPWTQVKEDVIRPEGWYCPRVLSKWQEVKGGEVEAVLATGGDYYEMEKYYKFTVMPISIKTDGKYPPPSPRPESRVVDDAEIGNQSFQFSYSGVWEYRNREKALGGGEHFSDQAGSQATIRFVGSRVKWFASKENNLGIAAVSIDKEVETRIDLYTYCPWPQYGRLLYDSGDLEPGEHTLRIRVTGDRNVKSGDVTISHDRVEIILSPENIRKHLSKV